MGEYNFKCRDVSESQKFYQEILGFKFVETEGDCVRLELSDKRILLMPLDKNEEPRITFDLMTDSVPEAKKKLEAAGYKTEDRKYEDWKFFAVKDPNGLEIEIIDEK